ncbi:unnamed protein product [Clonostachys chloroleuca]|uniref:Glucanase n=1 Tax=Clonostachys chloroleuca TaxID=1926264 RepID=A0AA35MIZ4_9HYPO|nr:unnamed protein product [Clonostachys chloroleuca]
MHRKIAAITAFIAAASAQQACTSQAETHPPLTWQTCTTGGSCTTNSASVVLDSNWRWTHTVSGSTNCYSGNKWDTSICTSNTVCAEKCCVDGADYPGTYGVTTSGSQLNLRLVTEHTYGKTIGSRVYLMQAGSDTQYQTFDLLGNEFTFDTDVSKLECGLNGALYFVKMEKDGGLASYPGNKAGAKFGTGYCDSQCPRDVKFIGGQANVEDWVSGDDNPDAGVGGLGACCAEMDIWEANKISTAYTPHPCQNSNYHVCDGDSCGGTYSADRYAGDCDPDGCDFNSWRQGNKTFYGPGSNFVVDTTKKVTVVTQFHTSGGSLSEIRRLYVQDGKVIANSQDLLGTGGNSITQGWCEDIRDVFTDRDSFTEKGGLAQMGKGLNGMVLVLSLWNDFYANMLWLDSNYPVGSTKPGADRGSCPTSSGAYPDVINSNSGATVSFSCTANIKFGPIGSTYGSGTTNPGTTTTARATSTTTSGSSQPTGTSPIYGQCGGSGWSGPTSCASGSCCTFNNAWYSQCLPC